MAISSNSPIIPSEINSGFSNAVIATILSGAYDINNVPRDGIYECIQSSRLGNRNSIPTPNVGSSGEIISAAKLYNDLVSITTVLTRVGTFSYVRTYQYNYTTTTVFSASGKALFTADYIRSLAAVSNPDISTDKVISANNINVLFANLLTAWNNTSKHHNVITNATCHSDCHSDCYSDCYSDCDCYK